MSMAIIRSLKPNVTEAEAVRQFTGRGIAALLRRARPGALRCVADVYLPFRLYQVQISNGGSRQTRWFALEAVRGQLDLYDFERVPVPAELVEVETRNSPAPLLTEAQAQELLAEKLRRMIFQKGFFRIRDLGIRAKPVPLDLHIPYWIGFYDAGKLVRLRVLDAVRRRLEGAKARAFFETWLAGC